MMKTGDVFKTGKPDHKRTTETAVPLPLWERVLIGLGFPACIALVCSYILLIGKGVLCPFYTLTGFYCPGCGSGRAVSALLHGHPLKMFSYNCMLVIMGLPCSCILIHEYFRLVWPGLHLSPVYVPQRIVRGCLIVLILYWIVRNIPAFSFLAPGTWG